MSGCGTVKVALAGCGTVGGELVRVLRASESWPGAPQRVRVVLTRVLVRDVARPRAVRLPPGVLTADVQEFLEADADIIVEAIGGIEPAATIAARARARGLPFVSANKALIAARGDALTAGGGGPGLWFEAAVAGGVPVVRVLRDYLGRGTVRRVRGILNGTCNYVLTRIERGDSFGVALDEARRRGFAETDCARDLDGRDAADKIAILAWLAFGAAPSELRVDVRGILPDPERLVRGAAAAGGRVRLLAECVRDGDQVRARVEPVVVAADSPFGRTIEEENRVLIDAGWPWPIELAGPGAGGAPTAAALFADIMQATSSRHHAGVGSSSAPHACDVAGGREDVPRRFVVGVPGASARAARVALAAGGVSSDVVAASADDAWLVTAPVRRLLLDHLVTPPEHDNGATGAPHATRSTGGAVIVALDDVPEPFGPRTTNGRHAARAGTPAGVA